MSLYPYNNPKQEESMTAGSESRSKPVDLIFPEAKRVENIRLQHCVEPPFGCGKPANEFKDEVSEHEYRISGLCQTCQDDIFGGGDD
jgi:hypothetical protein